jgi:hypothetical protein
VRPSPRKATPESFFVGADVLLKQSPPHRNDRKSPPPIGATVTAGERIRPVAGLHERKRPSQGQRAAFRPEERGEAA